jgi:hypothetical protein
MTLADIEKINDEFLLADDIAPLLQSNPQSIRGQAQENPAKLGFPVIVVGTHVKIPKAGFLFFMKYGRPVPA